MEERQRTEYPTPALPAGGEGADAGGEGVDGAISYFLLSLLTSHFPLLTRQQTTEALDDQRPR